MISMLEAVRQLLTGNMDCACCRVITVVVCKKGSEGLPAGSHA